MNRAKRKQINEVAETVLRSLNLAPPVDVREAVKLLGGEIKFLSQDSGGVAKIEKHDKGFIIWIENPSSVRNRFSIAHELGHLFLHMGYLGTDDRWKNMSTYQDAVRYRYGYSEEEYEANEFAGAFLMPEEDFRDIIEKNRIRNRVKLDPIAQHFDVSIEAVKIRGRFLGIFSWD